MTDQNKQVAKTLFTMLIDDPTSTLFEKIEIVEAVRSELKEHILAKMETAQAAVKDLNTLIGKF